MQRKSPKHKEYERKTAAVLPQIFERRGAKCIEVTQSARVETIVTGQKSQVDVLIKLLVNGALQQLAVECKYHTRRVSKTLYGSFRGALVDLKEQHTGMMISRFGFQKGARDLARANSISMCTLTESKPEYFSDLTIPEINARGEAFYESVDQLQLRIEKLPQDQLRKTMEFCKATDAENVVLSTGGQSFSLREICQQIIRKWGHRSIRKIREFSLRNDTTITVPEIGEVRLLGIKGIFVRQRMAKFPLRNRVDMVFADPDRNEVFLIDQNLSIIRPGENLTATSPWIDLAPYFKSRPWEKETN